MKLMISFSELIENGAALVANTVGRRNTGITLEGQILDLVKRAIAYLKHTGVLHYDFTIWLQRRFWNLRELSVWMIHKFIVDVILKVRNAEIW